MRTITLPSGISVTLPDDLSLPDDSARASDAPVRATRGPRPQFEPIAPMPADSDEATRIAEALADQDLKLVGTVPLPAVPAEAAVRRAEPADASLEIPLEAGEDAVVLLERDGVYAWQFEANRTEPPPADPGRRRRRGVDDTRRTATFRISLSSPPPDAPGAETRVQRGALSDALIGGARALVFKFAGRFLVGRATAFLERHVRPGVIAMKGDDPLAWANVGDFTAVDLPSDRPGRILLFVHGTFSSTKGGYGGLCATPWGRTFLAAAAANYDAIVGFDHATLSVDPRVNATELLRALEARPWTQPVHVDVICHSRGAITLRSLTEHLLPAARLPLTIERVVFVGGVNGGTKLAAPKNWRALIDLYTNLAVGATRAMALFPSAVFASKLLNELVTSVGTLAKALVDAAIVEEAIPGLAAMQPDGKFIRELNATQPGQPAPDKCRYYAITSEFEAKLALDKPSELSGQFLRLLADGFMDRLMGEVNDLVVHTASMTAIDPQVGNFIKDTLAFGSNSIVYHTNYFLQPLAVNALARWLELAIPEEATGRRSRGAVAGRHMLPDLAAGVDTDILVLPATLSGIEARETIHVQAPSYVVIERYVGEQRYRYGFKAEEVSARAQGNGTLENLLGLQETGRSAEHAPGTPPPPPPNPGSSSPAAHRLVVVEGDRPLGVAERKATPVPLAELAEAARAMSAPEGGGAVTSTTMRRLQPTLLRSNPAMLFTVATAMAQPPQSASDIPIRVPRSPISDGAALMPEANLTANDLFGEVQPAIAPSGAGAPAPAPAPPAAPAPATCQFLAEMDDVAIKGQIVSVDVTVAREAIEAVRKSSAAATAGVAPDRKIIVDLIPKKNFRNAGDTSRAELDVPAPGKPWSWTFDVEATDLGDGEIWVRFRQGPQPLVTLTLRCVVADKSTQPARRQAAEARVAEPHTPAPPLHQLTIFELERGGKRAYQFILDSPELKWKNIYISEALEGDREKYVNGIYQTIEERWLSNQNDVKLFELELKEIGAGLWDELFPADLRDELWDKRGKIESILVFSEEPFIPWELVFMKERGKKIAPEGRFLAQLGLLRWQHNAGWPAQKLHARPGRCRYVIPKYPMPKLRLTEAEQEEIFLVSRFKATKVTPNLSPVRLALSQPDFDLLHFACHGDAELADISRAELLLEGRAEGANYVYERLHPSVIEHSANFAGPDSAPIVVLNACRAARAGYKLTNIGGFARAFVKGGAGLFIGALWAVGDKSARTFTETLYARLLEGDTLAKATVAAREAARAAGEGTWLAYNVYGNPHATLSVSVTGNGA